MQQTNECQRCDLSHADLSGANLVVADLTDVNLSHADLTGDQSSAALTTTQRKIVAYLPGYATNATRKYSIDDVPGFPTHLIYGFAGLQDNGANPATVTTPEPKDPTKNFVKLKAYHQRFPNTKLMVSIGGWNHSHTDDGPNNPDPTPLFAKIAADPAWRSAFVTSALDTFIRRTPQLFDGIDLDWEFPTTPADKTNFTLLAREFRSQLDAQGTRDGRRYVFSIAIGIDPSEIDLPSVAQSADLFNVMAYNFHVASGRPGDVTNFENPLDSAPGDPTAGSNVTTAIKGLLATGVAPSKFILGVTSYAHSYAGVASTNNGLYQPYTGPGPGTYTHPGILTFTDVATNYIPKCTSHVVGAWHSSWLYCAAEKVFISYESVEEIREKAVFAKKQSLGGMMIWEIGADDHAALLGEANTVLNAGCAVGDACGSHVCNDGTCQSGVVTSCATPSHPVCMDGCGTHGGVNPRLGCVQTP